MVGNPKQKRQRGEQFNGMSDKAKAEGEALGFGDKPAAAETASQDFVEYTRAVGDRFLEISGLSKPLSGVGIDHDNNGKISAAEFEDLKNTSLFKAVETQFPKEVMQALKDKSASAGQLDTTAFRRAMENAGKAYAAAAEDGKVGGDEFKKVREQAISGFKPLATPVLAGSSEAKR